MKRLFLCPTLLVCLGMDCDESFNVPAVATREGVLRVAAPAVTIAYCDDDYPARVVFMWRTGAGDQGHTDEIPGDSVVSISPPGATEISVLVSDGDCFHGTRAVSLAVSWCGAAACQPLYLLGGLDWPFSSDLYPYVAPGGP